MADMDGQAWELRGRLGLEEEDRALGQPEPWRAQARADRGGSVAASVGAGDR